ncbi:unnamed protein product, partial [Effrenium voratum]
GEKSGDEVSGGEEVSDGKEVRGEEAEDDGEAALASSQDSEKTLRLGQSDSPRAVVAISPSTPCNETQLPSPDQPLLDQTAPDHADTNELLKVSNGYCSDEDSSFHSSCVSEWTLRGDSECEDGSEENAPMETQYVLVPKPALERKRSCVDVVAESEQAAKRSRQEEVDTAYDCAKPRVKKADPGRSRAPGKATKKGKKQNPPRATFKRGHTKKVKAVKGGADAAPGSSDADQEVATEYNGYSLEGIPQHALPSATRINKGLHSYTCAISVHDEPNESQVALVDVLLRNRAYYVKRCLPNGKCGQVSWKKYGGPELALQKAIELARTGKLSCVHATA